MKSKIQIGDIFKTKIGEVYAYLGRYEGKPWSMYNVPDNGYLYVFCTTGEWENLQRLEHNIDVRAYCGFDGSFCYTKNPKRFVEKLGHLDIKPRNRILGLSRVTI